MPPCRSEKNELNRMIKRYSRILKALIDISIYTNDKSIRMNGVRQMNQQDIYQLINSNPAFSLATVEGDQPRVRGMLLYKADESGIIFHTGAMKDVYKQILTNNKVEMCFNDFNKGIQVRVNGQLEELQDNALKDEITEHPSRTFLKPWKESGSLSHFYNTFIVYRLRNGMATTWNIEKNFLPKDEIQL